MSEIKNLWPKDLLEGDDIVLPITILNNQAKFLNNMTKNVLTAKIDTVKASTSRQSGQKPAIVHIMKIVAPAIGNYDFELTRATQRHLHPYPVEVDAPLAELKFECNNKDELESRLSEIFSNENIITTIKSLILQSNATIDIL